MRPPLLVSTLALTLWLSVGCGGSQAPLSSTAGSTPPSTVGIVAFDAGSKTVKIKLVAGMGGGFNFNGFSNGQLKITVPENWAVTVDCSNQAPTEHSCAITADASATAPVFPGAATPNPTVGLIQGQSASFSFTPDRLGTFRIACLVPGHQDSGMWDTFAVVASGQPSISPP